MVFLILETTCCFAFFFFIVTYPWPISIFTSFSFKSSFILSIAPSHYIIVTFFGFVIRDFNEVLGLCRLLNKFIFLLISLIALHHYLLCNPLVLYFAANNMISCSLLMHMHFSVLKSLKFHLTKERFIEGLMTDNVFYNVGNISLIKQVNIIKLYKNYKPNLFVINILKY